MHSLVSFYYFSNYWSSARCISWSYTSRPSGPDLDLSLMIMALHGHNTGQINCNISVITVLSSTTMTIGSRFRLVLWGVITGHHVNLSWTLVIVSNIWPYNNEGLYQLISSLDTMASDITAIKSRGTMKYTADDDSRTKADEWNSPKNARGRFLRMNGARSALIIRCRVNHVTHVIFCLV